MREHEYRVWDKENKKMNYDGRIEHSHGSTELSLTFDGSIKEDFTCCCDNETDYSGEESYIIMEWTGLKDKNNKKIYEGDIVKSDFTCGHKNSLEVIEWDNDNCGFDELGYDYCCPNPYCDSYMLDKKTIEVVGNKIQNPELTDRLISNKGVK